MEGHFPMQCNKMQQNATLETLNGLSPAQVTAIEAILAGKTITAAASAAGVDRVTLHRWLKADGAFQAELNRARSEIRLATVGSLERLAAKAAACVEKAIDEGDVKAALEILLHRHLKLSRRVQSGPTTPRNSPGRAGSNPAHWKCAARSPERARFTWGRLRPPYSNVFLNPRYSLAFSSPCKYTEG